MYELLYKPPTKLMLLVGCSLVTTIVAEAASRYNLVTVRLSIPQIYCDENADFMYYSCHMVQVPQPFLIGKDFQLYFALIRQPQYTILPGSLCLDISVGRKSP